MEFAFGILSTPKHIQSLTVYCEGFCIETNSVAKSTYVLDKNHSVKRVWVPYTMSLENCINCNELTFGLYLNILSIEYNDKYKLGKCIKYFSNPKINSKLEKRWIISDDLLNKFKTSKGGKYFESNPFGVSDNFCFVCNPNGYSPQKIGKLYYAVRLLKLPNNINKITVNYTLSVIIKEPEYKKLSHNSNRTVSYDNFIIPSGHSSFQTKWLNDIKTELIFGVNMEITQMYDKNDEIIPKEKWLKKYDVAPSKMGNLQSSTI